MSKEKTVYHWSETREVSAPIYPDMIQTNGFNVPVKCRLKGQSNKGPLAATAELRVVTCDINYCYHKLSRMLKRLSYAEQAKLLTSYLDSIGANNSKENDNTGKNFDSWQSNIQQAEVSAHPHITGGLSDA